MARWQEIKIRLNREVLEATAAILERWGISSFAVQDTLLYEEAREFGWGDYFPEIAPSDLITVIFYFKKARSPEDLEEIRREILDLSRFGLEPGPVEVAQGFVREEDWAQAWKAHYRPQRIGRVLIKPSWQELGQALKPDDLLIHLDPGLAFGSGTHPTTVMCLRFLQDLELAGQGVWDVGCGSGILAIAAEKLGGKVQAVDLDPLAVAVALKNRSLNKLTFSVREGSLEVLEGSPQVIVANIAADVLGSMLPVVFERLESGGFFIAAGVIEERDGEIQALARGAGFSLLKQAREKEWVGYLFQKGD